MPDAVEIQSVIDRMDRRTDVAKKLAGTVIGGLMLALAFLGWQLDSANDQVNKVSDVQDLQSISAGYDAERADRVDCIRDVTIRYTIADKENALAVTLVVNVAIAEGEGPVLDAANAALVETRTRLDRIGMQLEEIRDEDRCRPVLLPEELAS